MDSITPLTRAAPYIGPPLIQKSTAPSLPEETESLLSRIDEGLKKIEQLEHDFISLRLQAAESRLSLTTKLVGASLSDGGRVALADLRAYGKELQSLGRQIGAVYDLDEGLALFSAQQVSNSLAIGRVEGTEADPKTKAVLSRFSALVSNYNALTSVLA